LIKNNIPTSSRSFHTFTEIYCEECKQYIETKQYCSFVAYQTSYNAATQIAMMCNSLHRFSFALRLTKDNVVDIFCNLPSIPGAQIPSL